VNVDVDAAAQMDCDGIAPFYETLERLAFGGVLERSRFAFLDEVRTAERAILCGDGDGRFLAALLEVNPRVQVDFVDLSERMVELARRRVAKVGADFGERVRFFAKDIREFSPRKGGYDLIATHFVLDCFGQAEIREVVAVLAGCAAPGAQWLVSEFCEAETAMRALWTRAVIRGLYAAFRWSTGLQVTRLPNFAAAMAEEGFLLSREVKRAAGLLQSSLWRGPFRGG
jgi:ubiquinone/menaquinone biosynthesis C-methylase UbiE